MKIPTLLVLLIIFLVSTLVVLGGNLLHQKQQPTLPEVTPLNIAENNLGTDSATITWQTATPTQTAAIVSSDSIGAQVLQNLKDNRDNALPESRLTHIVTINNLPSNAVFFKINVNGKSYPQAAIKISPLTQNPAQLNFNPVVGSVVNQSLRPINDALIFLDVPNAYPLATGVGQNGSFILPVSLLAFKDSVANPQASISGTLVVESDGQRSVVQITIGPDSKPLLPIVLGQNFDFR